MKLKSASNLLNIIIYTVVILSLLYTVYLLRKMNNDGVDSADEIKRIKTELDSIQSENKRLFTKIEAYNSEITGINNKIISTYTKIDIINEDISTIKTNTSEKTNSIDSFNNSDIYMFFSTRYEYDKNK